MLFNQNTTAKNQSYSAQDIEVLEGLEPVRRRPGMYIGGTDQKALHHLVAEILDNSMDEVVAGFATEIHISILKNNKVMVRDNGRGIPVDPHPKFPDKSALEVILTTLHSGGKFSSKAYQTSGGLHGVGMSVVNALSDALEVKIWRDGFEYYQTYSKGHVLEPLSKKEFRKKGTQITFHPDPEIFGDLEFKPKDLFNLVKSKAYLHKGVKIHWACEIETDIPLEHTFYFQKGLEDFLIQGQAEVDQDLIFASEGIFPDKMGRTEWALQWVLDDTPSDDEVAILTFCNTIPTPLGGTHETGFRSALLKSVKEIGERLNKKSYEHYT